METHEHIHVLAAEGRLLAKAAAAAGPAAPVPTCPGWHVRDLLRHTGTVHRWAASFLTERHTSPRPPGPEPDLDGRALTAWYEESHSLLLDALDSAPEDVRCWAFLPAPSPLAFWARRQAHETTVHRVDAERSLGDELSAISPEFALDGIDELLRGFHTRAKSRVRTSGPPAALRVRATTEDGTPDTVWTVRLSPEPPVVEAPVVEAPVVEAPVVEPPVREPGAVERDAPDEARGEVSGPPDRLYLALWNRAPFPHTTGDPTLPRLWTEASPI